MSLKVENRIKLNRLDPYAYLSDVLKRLPT
ncbi:MAG: transposase domain-containing protein, partial [Acinetobacter sp.]|nr:transposase domain-containing protein [Acinetobacter sp.]